MGFKLEMSKTEEMRFILHSLYILCYQSIIEMDIDNSYINSNKEIKNLRENKNIAIGGSFSLISFGLIDRKFNNIDIFYNKGKDESHSNNLEIIHNIIGLMGIKDYHFLLEPHPKSIDNMETELSPEMDKSYNRMHLSRNLRRYSKVKVKTTKNLYNIFLINEECVYDDLSIHNIVSPFITMKHKIKYNRPCDYEDFVYIANKYNIKYNNESYKNIKNI